MIVNYTNEHGHICFEDFKKILIVKEKDGNYVYGTHLDATTFDVYDEDLLCIIPDNKITTFISRMGSLINEKKVIQMPGA